MQLEGDILLKITHCRIIGAIRWVGNVPLPDSIRYKHKDGAPQFQEANYLGPSFLLSHRNPFRKASLTSSITAEAKHTRYNYP